MIACSASFAFAALQVNDLRSQVSRNMLDLSFANMRVVDFQIHAGDGYDFKAGYAGAFSNIAPLTHENLTHASLPDFQVLWAYAHNDYSSAIKDCQR
jgi:hypothetical protein